MEIKSALSIAGGVLGLTGLGLVAAPAHATVETTKPSPPNLPTSNPKLESAAAVMAQSIAPEAKQMQPVFSDRRSNSTPQFAPVRSATPPPTARPQSVITTPPPSASQDSHQESETSPTSAAGPAPVTPTQDSSQKLKPENAANQAEPAPVTLTSAAPPVAPPQSAMTTSPPSLIPDSPQELETSTVNQAEQAPVMLTQGSSQELEESNTADEAEQIRQELQVEPLLGATTAARTYPPSPNAGIPSGFGAGWGDTFASLSVSGADRLRPEADGSMSFGFGLGDASQLVGVELAYNLQSIRNFAENGSFDVKVHRNVVSTDRLQMSAAVGWNGFATYGSNANDTSSTVYGAVSGSYLLQPDNPGNRMPLTATVGVGGNTFSPENSDVGIFTGLGIQVDPRLSLNTAWSGVGLNIGASVVPIATVPLTMNFIYGDVTNETPSGSVAIFSIGYGFNFGARFNQ